MTQSQRIAGLLGPAMAVILLSEFPLVQPGLYDEQIPPVVYLSGVLMFVAGLAIVRSHNVWARDWTLLVTLYGWALALLGLVRMFAASQYRAAAATGTPGFYMVIEGALFAVALFLTYKAYSRGSRSGSPPPDAT